MPNRLSGREIGQRNASALKAYLDSTPTRQIPMSDGRPNASEIARACSFDRKVLYDNAQCKALYEELLRRFDREIGSRPAPMGFSGQEPHQEVEKLQRELSRVHAQVTALAAENRSLRDLLRRARHIEDHLLETGRLVR